VATTLGVLNCVRVFHALRCPGFLYRGREWAPVQADPSSSLAEPDVIHSAVSVPGVQGFGDKTQHASKH
jgi:hypothetical protein